MSKNHLLFSYTLRFRCLTGFLISLCNISQIIFGACEISKYAISRNNLPLINDKNVPHFHQRFHDGGRYQIETSFYSFNIK